MEFALFDVNKKYLGEFTDSKGMKDLHKYARKAKATNLKGFLEQGAALVTTVLTKEIQALRPPTAKLRDLLDNLVRMVNDAELCVIISDGADVE
jgi:hypothetical protein